MICLPCLLRPSDSPAVDLQRDNSPRQLQPTTRDRQKSAAGSMLQFLECPGVFGMGFAAD
jgi:hypothetical protein